MKRHVMSCMITLTVLTVLAAESGLAAKLYREDFTSEGDSPDLSVFGWNESETGTNGGSTGAYGDPGGTPQDGFQWWYSNTSLAAATTVTELSYTTEFSPIDVADITDLSFEYRLERQFNDDFTSGSGTGTGVITRLALQLGGQWYVSAASFNSGNVESADWTLRSLAFDPTDGNWRVLNDVDGAPGVSLGAGAGFDLTGSVTGVGLVSTFNRYQTINYNFVEIAGVPEPTTFGLLACGAAGLFACRRH